MNPDLPDSKVLSYRASAVSLTRSAARLQKTLDTLQKSRDPNQKPIRAFTKRPAHTQASAPQEAKPAPAQAAPIPPKTARPPSANPAIPDPIIEKMQLNAHTAIKALQAQNVSLTSVAFPVIPDPAMAAKAAAQAAMASIRHKTSGPPR
jgi:hypothetical protein